MTLEELDRLPDDGNRYELIDGELFVSPAPRTKHQRISINFLKLLVPFVEGRNLGQVYHAPYDVYLDSQTRVEPDVLFIAQNHLPWIEDKGLVGAPDLVIEIFSESTWRADAFEKRDLYQPQACRSTGPPIPKSAAFKVYRFTESGKPRKLALAETLASPLFPGLEIPLSSIFDY